MKSVLPYSQIFLCMLLITGLSSCSRNSVLDYEGTISPAHGSDEMWINIGNELQSMDPHKIGGMTELAVLNNLFVRLTQADPKTGAPLPDLAESWDISKDGLEYTFHLRQDAKWSDGIPLTAADVEYSWKRLIDPRTAGLMSSMTDVIQNASEYRAGKKSQNEVAIKAIDEHTLWVKLSAPVAYFLGMIEHVIFAPLPRHLIEKLKAEKKEDQWTKPQHIVVSGPFKLIDESFKQYKVFEKNPFYYHADKVRLNHVRTVMIDGQGDLNAYRTGQHDWSCCGTIPNEQIEKLKLKKDFYSVPFFSTYFLMVNVNQKPFDDVKIRRAISLSIDRESIVKNILRGGQQATRDFVPRGTLGYAGIRSELYDPDAARKLLSDAGYPDGKGIPKISLKYNTADVHRYIAEAAQQMLKKNVNINIELVNEEWSVFMQDQNRGNFQMMKRSWIGDYLDPHSFLSVLLSDSTSNRSGWKNKEYDQLIALSNRELDQTKRFEYFKKAEEILAEEQPYIPIYYFTRTYLKKPYVHGFGQIFKTDTNGNTCGLTAVGRRVCPRMWTSKTNRGINKE